MTNSSLALKHRSDSLIFNIRGRHQRVLETGTPLRATLADILPLTAPIPALELAPITRSIGSTGRIRVAFGGRSLSHPDLMSWVPGALSVTLVDAWVVLRPDESERAARRNDGRCSFLEDARVRITEAVCLDLGLHFGDEVALLLLRDQNALALTNPARLLLGAPLSLVGASTMMKELVHA
ncbi:MAG TPA: hypothetical protein VNF05_09295 [Acidimicrobiales bacterium]|nr:hypothetical protein [Acidimicrobiales bacterium]